MSLIPPETPARKAQRALFKVAADALQEAGAKDVRRRWSVGMIEQAAKDLEEQPLKSDEHALKVVAALRAVKTLVDATEAL